MYFCTKSEFNLRQVLIEAGEGLVRFEITTLGDGTPYVIAHLDKSKIHSVGKEALRKFLIVIDSNFSIINF